MVGIWTRQVEIAEQIAAAFEAEGAQTRTRIWEDKKRGIVLVYVSRELSRGRRQIMGYVEVHPNMVWYRPGPAREEA